MQQRTSVEIQAYSVDEAVRLALDELGLTRDEVDIEVLSDAGPDEEAEALVRVTAKGLAAQPVPAPAEPTERGRPRTNDWRARTAPGDRPSQRGNPADQAASTRVDAEDEQIAKAVVSELLAKMGLEADVAAVDNPSTVPLDDDEPPTIFIDIAGNDLGMLIGRKGEHLGQIQYLVNLIVNRRLGESWTRVVIDVEGYRVRREESLIALAERVARQVTRGRRPIALDPMPPNERRVIHMTLRDHPDVTTESSGEGSQRHITIEPRS